MDGRGIKLFIINNVMSSFKTKIVPNVTISYCGGRVTAAPAKSREELILKHKFKE